MTANSDHILIRNPAVRWTFVASLGVTLAIFYWLVALRTEALDITFERIFNGLFMFHDYPLVLMSVPILMLALLPQARTTALHFADLVGRNIRLTAAIYFLLLAFGAMYVYHAHPLSMDEYAPVFQSKIFAVLELSGKFPAPLVDWLIPEGFQNYFLSVSHADGRVVSSYWPGFALLLTPFTALGVPWLCNPVLGAAGVLIVHRLALSLFNDRTCAGVAVLLTIAAPAFAINAISFYSMTAHLVLNGVFVLLLLKPTPARAFVAGLTGSLALCLHNPVPHVLFAAPWIVSMILAPQQRRLLPALICGYLPLSLVLGIGWPLLARDVSGGSNGALTSGGALVTMRLSDVFAVPLPGLLYARLIGLAKIWIWAVPASVIVAAIGYWRWRDATPVRLFAWSAGLTFIGYLFVPFDQGHGWGFRYFHSAWFAIPLLAAAAIAPRGNAEPASSPARVGLAGYVAACAMLGLLLVLPLSAVQVESFISTHLAQQPAGNGPGVIILRPASGFYAYDLVQNDPFLRDPVIRMVSQGRKADDAMMAENFSQLVVFKAGLNGSVWIKASAGDGAGNGASDLRGMSGENQVEQERTE